MERLVTPLAERAEEWRRGCNGATGALSREHARECKRARAELRRRVQDAQRHARKARRATPDVKRRADVCLQVTHNCLASSIFLYDKIVNKQANLVMERDNLRA